MAAMRYAVKTASKRDLIGEQANEVAILGDTLPIANAGCGLCPQITQITQICVICG